MSFLTSKVQQKHYQQRQHLKPVTNCGSEIAARDKRVKERPHQQHSSSASNNRIGKVAKPQADQCKGKERQETHIFDPGHYSKEIHHLAWKRTKKSRESAHRYKLERISPALNADAFLLGAATDKSALVLLQRL